MNPSEAIRQKIEAKRSELREHEDALNEAVRIVQTLKTELATWEEALRVVTMVVMDDVTRNDRIEKSPVSEIHEFRNPRIVSRAVLDKSTEDFRRGPKGVWREIMPQMLRLYPKEVFGLQDVAVGAELVNATVKADAIRSQMSNYVKAGYLDRVNTGRFRFTELGQTTFSELSNKPSPLRLVTESPATDDVPVAGVSPGGAAPLKASEPSFSVGGVPR
jgi:hypothetical protein